MNFSISTSANNKVFYNGDLVDYKKFEGLYDGQHLQAEYQDNDTIYYTKLNKKQLSDLMLQSNNNSDLDIRLLNDFPIKNKKSKQKTLSSKKKSSKKNTSMKNRIASINNTIY